MATDCGDCCDSGFCAQGYDAEDEFDARPEHDASMCGGDEESCRCECSDCQVTSNQHNRGSFDWIG